MEDFELELPADGIEVDPLSAAVDEYEAAKAERARKRAEEKGSKTRSRKPAAKAAKEAVEDAEPVEATNERGWFVINCYSGYEKKVRNFSSCFVRLHDRRPSLSSSGSRRAGRTV